MATKIITKNSSTTTAIPTAGDLVQGELAVNVTDKRLFTENAAGAIVELGTAPSTIDINAGTIDGTVIGGTTAAAGSFTSLQFDGLNPTVTYDFNGSGTVTSDDSLAYLRLGSGISTGVDISATPVVAPSWSAATGTVYADNKFRILVAKGNSTDALTVAGAGSASGYGDTVVIGNVDVNGTNTKLTAGLGINGNKINLVGDVTTSGAATFGGAVDVTGTVTASAGINGATGINITGNGGYYNAANKFGIDVNVADSRFYVSGPDTITRGTLSIHQVASDGTLDITSLRIDASGNVGIGTNVPATALSVVGDVTVSGGVYLGGTGAANKLDDYEEGTWSPVSGGQPMNSSGHYTKVGRMVSIILDATSHASATASGSISGLPFTPVSAHAAFNVGYTTSAAGLTGGYLSIYSGALAFTASGGSSIQNLGASERVMLTCTYQTS